MKNVYNVVTFEHENDRFNCLWNPYSSFKKARSFCMYCLKTKADAVAIYKNGSECIYAKFLKECVK